MTRLQILQARRVGQERLVALNASVHRYYSYMRSIPSKRTSKAKSNATGQVLANSKITHQVGLHSQLIGLSAQKQ